MSRIRVLVSGACGRMGSEVVRAVMAEADLELVGAVDPRSAGEDAGRSAGLPDCGIAVSRDLESALAKSRPDVAIDFTEPGAALTNALAVVKHGARPVIGTTGIPKEGIEYLRQTITEKGSAGLLAPNFAIGAVLLMKFAAEAVRYLPDCEIIELHHDGKKDAPSGTSIYTAELIAKSRAGEDISRPKVDEQIIIPGVRGGRSHEIPIHSVRLAGFVASQEVIFGGPGQTLSLRHDTIDRKCFMPGVILAARRIPALTGFFYGLESIL
ncbi:MAG TPA: 4-hydroxy-tetrahydrodipicolinate reductase [Armatimonadota bacterium]|nr:4-hydroxy-tetrahydrodipicolinate reductase [Armatimonadota bacterium]